LADFRAFTYHIPQDHRHAIVIDIKLGIPLPVENTPEGRKLLINAKALVDTGASGFCVSRDFAKSSRRAAFTMTEVLTAKGSDIVPAYHLDLLLPNNVMFVNIPSVEFAGGRDFDFILGMDILSKGDVAITNANNEMVFSFRIPPGESHTDYTE
jgi:hypothetical protein